jgi:hypothetical protein
VRARGKGSELKPAEYQIRIGQREWPKKWTKTDDLARPMGLYGFDVRWKFVPKIVRDWVLGLRKMPTEQEIMTAPERRRKIGPRRPITSASRKWRTKRNR